jgi:tetratricopeptide (TPR) repeat protein
LKRHVFAAILRQLCFARTVRDCREPSMTIVIPRPNGRGRRRPARMAAGVTTALFALLLATGAAKVETGAMPPVADSLSGNYLAALAASKGADLGESARFFSEALANDPEDPFLLERTLVLSLAAGDLEDAIGYAGRLQDIDRENPLAALSLGIDALRGKRWAVAVAEFKRANSGPLVGLTSEVLAAWAETGAGSPAKALARLDKLSGEQWYSFFRNYHGGLIAQLSGDEKEAVKRFKAAREIDDNAISVIEAYARALARDGQLDAARTELRAAMERVPDHPLLTAVMADIDAGKKPHPQVPTVSAGAAEILSGLGSAISRDDTGELAIVYLQLALLLDPDADLARITLAEVFERSKQYERAIELLAAVKPESPLKRNAEIMIGFDYNALEKVDEARAHLSKLVEADPSDLDAVTALGNVLRAHKMFAEAAEVYSRGIATLKDPAPENWQLFYNRGIAFERTKQWPKAEADFKTALKLRPDQPLVLNYLGYSWVDQGMNYDEALAMIKKAVELEPTDGYIVDSLGWVYFKLGRYEEAVEELERAVDLKPEDPVINDHLGDAYWKVGRKLEARFQWNHAKDRKPEPEDLQKILKKLEDGLPDPTGPASADAAAPSTTRQ